MNEINTLINKLENLNIDDNLILKVKDNGLKYIDNMLKSKVTYTQPGSIYYLLYGKQISVQSLNIKLGYFGEYFIKELIKINNDYKLLNCGIQTITNCDTKKDIDILFKNKNTIYYLELKANIYLDTEKKQATIDKMNKIKNHLQIKYPTYNIDIGILNWTLYDNKLNLNKSIVKKFQKNGIKIIYMSGFLNILSIIWNENDFLSYFYLIGNKIKNHF